MTVAEVIRAAMALTPDERALVADALYDADEGEQSVVDAAWSAVFIQRADDIDTGTTETLTREAANAVLDAHHAERSA